MPCNCDYLEPNIKYSKIHCVIDEFVIDELLGKQVPKDWWRGYHPNVYNQTYDKYANFHKKSEIDILEHMHRIIAKICEDEQLATEDVIATLSFEAQIWWRDYTNELVNNYKEQEEKRKKREVAKRGLEKLSDEEKEALGL
jgi:hypothetical protein